MDEQYDVIVLGTGLKECILSGLLSVDGLKVLHMDRNDYYGGAAASLNPNQLWQKFRGQEKPPISKWCFSARSELQFMMANGALVRVLIHTDVTKYLFFKAVDGSDVYKQGKIYKVPSNDAEALKSPLMGIFEKRHARKFFIFVQIFDEDSRTHDGMDLRRCTTKELFEKYGLDDNTIDFVGYSLALHRDDRFLSEPALDTVQRVKLYADSMTQFQGRLALYLPSVWAWGVATGLCLPPTAYNVTDTRIVRDLPDLVQCMEALTCLPNLSAGYLHCYKTMQSFQFSSLQVDLTRWVKLEELHRRMRQQGPKN